MAQGLGLPQGQHVAGSVDEEELARLDHPRVRFVMGRVEQATRQAAQQVFEARGVRHHYRVKRQPQPAQPRQLTAGQPLDTCVFERAQDRLCHGPQAGGVETMLRKHQVGRGVCGSGLEPVAVRLVGGRVQRQVQAER